MIKKVCGRIVVPRAFSNNAIFDREHYLNRDDCLKPYRLLQKRFEHYGIYLKTADLVDEKLTAFDIHIDVQRTEITKYCYLLMLETPQINRRNSISSDLSHYRKIFTWNDQLVDGEQFVKINFPNTLRVYPADGFSKRVRFCCLISANKTMDRKDSHDLYPERVKLIRWFENNAADDFDLYGIDWNMPVLHGGLLGLLERKMFGILGKIVTLRPFPSYRGKVKHKHDVLRKTRFSICYENVRDIPGYITEKIFDSFFSGCVPVYWGANNIADYIPPDCFIDRRNYSDTSQLYAHLKSIKESEFQGYQRRIASFLSSDAARLFSSEYFVETLVDTIIYDLCERR